MSFVRIKDNDNFDDALRRFKKKVEKDGVLQDHKKHRYFEKPSDKKRRERTEAIKKANRKKKR